MTKIPVALSITHSKTKEINLQNKLNIA